ncbi:MAG: hypothetical protein HQL72_11270 [Magnetococcales bacterium]|nr:hypothetical protein [Magnetococcales bacterium]
MFKFLNMMLKGSILLVWIFLLAVSALYSVSNTASEEIIPMFESKKRFNFWSDITSQQDEINPRGELEKYLAKNYSSSPPPIESVLELFMNEPHWATRLPKVDDDRKKAEWERLFKKIDHILTALAEKHVPGTKSSGYYFSFVEMIPSIFTEAGSAESAEGHSLPKEVENWVVTESPKIAKKKANRTLIDTFVLLMVLGAFGSLIFLTKEFISGETSSVGTYIFRPILGIFLAVAMFVVDIAAHTLISSADLFEINRETLYFLAFAAGLLSEQAYNMVNLRAKLALEAKKEQIESERNRRRAVTIEPEQGSQSG